MTATTKTILKTYFQLGDFPTESQFADLIDSFPQIPASNGIIVQVSAGDSQARSIDGTSNEISVSAANGLTGNPTLALASILNLTGKTVTVATASAASSDTTVASTAFVGTARLLNTKAGTFTRDATTASGSQAVTGVGFVPRALVIFATINTTKPASWAFCDSSATSYQMLINDAGNAGQMFAQTGIVFITVSLGNTQTAVVASLDSDGFTLAWTKTGSPTGTITLNYLAIR